MNRTVFFLLLCALTMLSCVAIPAATPTVAPTPTMPTPRPLNPSPVPTVTAACISPEPSQKDIDRALAFTGGAFDAEWEKSYTVSQNRVSVTWLNNPLGAVAYLEALIFPCGYEEPDLNNYYDENWGVIFQNYESYEETNACKRNNGLRLYEFEAQNQGFKYAIKYWVKNDTDTRVISLMMVFPLELKNTLDDYSARLFPNDEACP